MPGQQVVPPKPEITEPGYERLGLLASLLDRLHAAEIRYCHWTGTESMPAVLAGEKDLDLLVDRRAAQALGHILCELGFKRFDTPPGRGDPGIEDHLGMDPATGKLVHLHLHYQLIVGGPALKGHHLPWEEVAFSTRVLQHEWGIYTLEPHLALIILATRSALQLRSRDLLSGVLDGPGVSAATLRKFDWLAERVVPERLVEVGRDLIGEAAARMLAEQVGSPPTARWLSAFGGRIMPRLDEYCIYPGTEERWQRWRRRIRSLLAAALHRYFPGFVPQKRVSPRGGLIVALIGADGSGKSTIVGEITRWLSWKTDVLPIYFGSGSGQVSLLRRPLRIYQVIRTHSHPAGVPPANGLAANGSSASVPSANGSSAIVPPANGPPANRSLASGSPASGPPQFEENLTESPALVERPVPRPGARFRWARQVWRGLWAWSIYREKRSRLRRARRARGQGRIVICDRYPQSQVMGFTDGPLLSDWVEHRHWIPRTLARREAAVYRKAANYPPDLVLRLVAPTEVAWQRKPERSLAALERRVQAIRALRFPPRTRIVEIDAAQPLDRVILAVKAAVWEAL